MQKNMNYQTILEDIAREVAPLTHQGKVADYIPALASVPLGKFGMAIQTVDGQCFSVGDSTERFSIQSMSKLFTLTMAFRLLGEDLWQRVGREPSGTPFNSLVQLEYEQGKPRNPFVNAGALVVTDILSSHYVQAEIAFLQFMRKLTGITSINFDTNVAISELATSSRNAAMAHFMKSFGNLKSPVDIVLNSYCHQCAVAMSCEEVAKAALFLANHGEVPLTGERLLTVSASKRMSAVMLTCGTYDAAGDFAFRVGLPAKSGVGGGIVAVIPGEASVCVWSPGLDANGNSLAGGMALELLTTMTGRSIF
ncbi:glutaminase [Leeia oryzae]|uniref:glutaminase n=1 Tax=Leeia oryzae TaxID=356662 RepID=UPI0003776095|nr:glutaminase [Leeia oryzae]